MSIRKRNYKSSTKYQVQYHDPLGRQRSKQFDTKREATAFEAAVTTTMRRGEWTDPTLKEIRFENWANDWLLADPGKRETSRTRDEIIVRLHLVPTFRNRLLSQITPMDVQKLVNTWTANHAPHTVHRHYRALAAIMRSAVNCDVIIKSPCRAIQLPKIERKQPTIATPDELQRIADNMGNFGPMVYLGAVLGMRWGEVAGLRAQDIDTEKNRLHIVQQVSRGKGGRPIVGPPKTSTAIRTIAMPPELTHMLVARASNTSNLIFATETGGPLSHSNWRRRIWIPACEEAGVSNLGFHDLRRANATAMVAAGVDIKTAQRRLGHADPRMTLGLYAQATTEGDQQAAAMLGAALLPKNVDRSRRASRQHDEQTFTHQGKQEWA